MGQRLVIVLETDEKRLAAMYFHWSAYPISTIMEVNSLIETIPESAWGKNPSLSYKELQLALIRYAESHGGGISGGKGSSEWCYIQKMFPKEDFIVDEISRNEGLICISDDGIEDLIAWADGIVYVGLDDGIICNYVCDDFKLTGYPSDDEIIKLPVNPVEYSYRESGTLAEFVSNLTEPNTPFKYFVFGDYGFDLIV